MKLTFIELAGFRGFKNKMRFELPSGFAVLTGRNGVGKSTVLDALDFGLTGTINKYVVRDAKGGGLDDHIWWVGDGAPDGQYVSIGFIGDDGKEFSLTRSRERGLDMASDDLTKLLCQNCSPTNELFNTLIQTSLIRDESIAGLSLDLPEQARFTAVRAAIGGLTGPDHAVRTASILKAANSAKTEQEIRVQSMQAELGRALTALTEARSVAERQPDIAEAQKIIESMEPQLSAVSGDRTEALRRRLVERKHAILQLQVPVARAEHIFTESSYLASEAAKAESSAAFTALDAARRLQTVSRESLLAAQSLDASERANDQFASHMISLLQHGETIGLQDGQCPLCAATRTSEEFSAAIAASRAVLNERGVRAEATMEKLKASKLALADSDQKVAAAEARVAELELRRQNLKEEADGIAQLFAKHGFSALPSDPAGASAQLLERTEELARLEGALFMLEVSAAHDNVTSLETKIRHLRSQVDEESAKLSAAERAVAAARQIDIGARAVSNQILAEQFDTVMPLLKELYRRLRPHADWREIETDFGGRVRASLNFTVGDGRNPQFLFSSGQRRAAGIAFLLAIHLSRPWCRLRSLLMDDPVQHIDDYRALNLVEVLSAIRRNGRQVIVAVEDPALADVLCRRLRSTASEGGRRFDLGTDKNGSAIIASQRDVYPMLREVLWAAEAS